MRRLLSGSALFTALWALPATTWAGPAPAGDDGELVLDDDMAGDTAAAPPKGKKAAGKKAGGLDALLDESDASSTAGQIGAGESSSGSESGPVDADDAKKQAAAQIKAEMGLITVVQRQRMLKKMRFDLQPQVGISVNDPYVRHYAFGLEMNLWLTNRMALGLTGTGFAGAQTPRYRNVAIQEGVLLTANKALWQASLGFLYNPFYGKISIFNRFLLHWETYVQIGGGAIQTRVIPRYKALHEPFDNITGQGNAALGVRFYLPKANFVSFNAGVRHFMYPDLLEPIDRGPGKGQDGMVNQDLESAEGAKKAADRKLGQLTTVFVGVSFYLPSTFEYNTPR